MKETLIHKWAWYILRRTKKQSRIWSFLLLLLAFVFIGLYAYHKTVPMLVGTFLLLFGALMWAERKAYCDIIEEKEKQIEELKSQNINGKTT